MAKPEKLTLLADGPLVERIAAAKSRMERDLKFRALPTTAILYKLVTAGLDQLEATPPGAGRPARKRP